MCRRPMRRLTRDANAGVDEDELRWLLDVARRRPLLDAMTVRRGKRQGEAIAGLRTKTRRRLERLGRERALIYKTLVPTRLRKGELASLTVGQLVLDASTPYLVPKAADEKNREGSTIRLRADPATDLREWLAGRARAFQEAAGDVASARFDLEAVRDREHDQRDSRGLEGQSCQQGTTLHGLPAATPVFIVPAGLRRILDRDLKAAGIPKRDDRGHTVDVHTLRHTFGTHLSKAGVAPRMVRPPCGIDHRPCHECLHRPRLLDVAGAVESLPALPIRREDGQSVSLPIAVKATGTED